MTAATFSPDRVYRYTLDRRVGASTRRIAWVMLNPSTADETLDDPTIRRCMGFSAFWGFGQMRVVNLFALRATRPAVLRQHPSPVGPNNDAAILEAARWADMVLVAWGALGTHRGQGARALRLLWCFNSHCLAVTQRSRQPVHPLYQRGDMLPRPLTEVLR